MTPVRLIRRPSYVRPIALRWTWLTMRRIRPTTLCAGRSAWPVFSLASVRLGQCSAWRVCREFKLTTRMVLSIGVVAVASLGAAIFYARSNAPPTCTSDWTLSRVSESLRDNFHLDSIIMNHIRTVSGGFFSSSHDCAAEVTEIRGGEDASGMSWREIRYRIIHQATPPSFRTTVELGGHVPLAPQTPSLWTRLLARL